MCKQNVKSIYFRYFYFEKKKEEEEENVHSLASHHTDPYTYTNEIFGLDVSKGFIKTHTSIL